jgi:hypothetical protein
MPNVVTSWAECGKIGKEDKLMRKVGELYLAYLISIRFYAGAPHLPKYGLPLVLSASLIVFFYF